MRRTIVIADTDVVLLELLRPRCSALGLRAETTTSGDEAVRLIRRLRPHLVCVQHDLCCTDGRTVCEALAGDPQASATPVIAMCDQTAENLHPACREIGSYVLRRSGNVWHRLEPLIYELIEIVERDEPRPSISSGSPSMAAGGCDGERAAWRSARDLRIDEPPRRAARMGETGVTSASAATASAPRRDARESVLDAVFTWFGHAKENKARAAGSDAAPAGLSGPHRRDSSEPPWVLCIEDDADFSLALKLRLEAHGIAVVRAFDGRAGYRAAFTHPAGAILLDYNLPQGQGDYVLRRLKENPVTADVPVIVLTGLRSAATRRQMLALGADAYLTKPLDFDELVEVLGEHVEMLPREFAAASY